MTTGTTTLREHASLVSSRTSWNGRFIANLTALIYALLEVVEIALGLRLLLRLIGIGPIHDFTHVITALTQPLVTPFQGLTEQTTARFDGSILVAMLAYAMIAHLAVQFILLFDTETEKSSSFDA